MKRVLVFVCAVATEAISWSGILVSGLGWIFTSRSVHDLIRSTVCIMFVQNVDEVVYEVKTFTWMGNHPVAMTHLVAYWFITG